MKVNQSTRGLSLLTDNTALGWLEYCNSDRKTYYANLRRKNGREKPYNVRLSTS